MLDPARQGHARGAPSRRLSPTRRRGSVLLFVVALVLLLAVVGTAYLSAARTDRYAVGAHEDSVQADLLLDGVTNAARAAIGGDLFGGGGEFRPPGDATDFDPFDSYLPGTGGRDDDFLAARVPVKFDPLTAVTSLAEPVATRNPPVWRALTGPLFNGEYESPLKPAGFGGTPLSYGGQFRENLAPTFVEDADGTRHPGLMIDNPATTVFDGIVFPAADATGDGIADAGYFRVAPGRINGLDWFAGVYVVDHGSAINVNTALDRRFDYTSDGAATTVGRLPLGDGTAALGTPGGTAFNPGFFASSVGLQQLLRTYDPAADTLATSGPESLELNNRRFGVADVAAANAVAGLLDNTANAVPFAEMADTPPTRPDMRFLTFGDALHHQLARRLDNPGRNAAASDYDGYGLADAAALAYRGGAIVSVQTGPSAVEQDLEASVYDVAAINAAITAPDNAFPEFRDQPFSLAGASPELDWFNELFDHGLENPNDPDGDATFTAWRSRRPLLTAYNPVANFARVGQGTLVVPLAIIDYGKNYGKTPLFNVPAEELAYPASGVVPKTSINTAGDADPTDTTVAVPREYALLWRGFWQVMAEPLAGGGFETPMADSIANPPAGHDPFDPYEGSQFLPDYPFTPGEATAFGIDAPQHPARMFRSPLRAPGPTWNAATDRLIPDDTLLLRAALAAVNLLDLRDRDDAVTVKKIELKGREVTLFGQERQPYLTEVYVSTDTTSAGGDVTPGPNPNGYVALEFYNPYDVPIDLSNCVIATLDRRPSTSTLAPTPPYPGMTLTDMRVPVATGINLALATSNVLNGATKYGNAAIVPPGGFLVIENYDAQNAVPPAVTDGRANYRPEAAGFRQPPAAPLFQGPVDDTQTLYGETIANKLPRVNVVYVNNLHLLLDREMALLRPHGAALVAATYNGVAVEMLRYLTLAGEPYFDFAPLDSFDFTGLNLPASAGGSATAWHYARETNEPWQFVYPGRYDANQTAAAAVPALPAGLALPRHQGTQRPAGGVWTPVTVADDPWNPSNTAYVAPAVLMSLGYDSIQATYNVTQFVIQLRDAVAPAGLSPLAPSTASFFNRFPFGGFARNADLLQVVYFGSYTVRNPANIGTATVLEVNSASMDAAFTDDTDVATDTQNTDGSTPPLTPAENVLALHLPGSPATPSPGADTAPIENVGRFAPLFLLNRNDLDPLGSYAASGGAGNRHRYRWARDLFEHFDVQSPQDDYLPNASPERYEVETGDPRPAAVRNAAGGTANSAVDALAGVEGRVNLNTAPVKVLETLPWLPEGDTRSIDPVTGAVTLSANGVNDNVDLARAIVYWRDGDPSAAVAPQGPFETVFDLYRVPAVRAAQGSMLFAVDPNDAQGDLTPPGTGVDVVRFDYEEQYLLLTRISNLVTTRSDVFTVYIVLEGWQDAGTTDAKRVVSRRRALIVDRSAVTPGNRSAVTSLVPTE